jgi:hypothetical protein
VEIGGAAVPQCLYASRHCISHTYFMLHPSDPPWFDFRNNICRVHLSREQVGSNSRASDVYPGGFRFEYRPADPITWMKIFAIFLSPSTSGLYIELGYDHSLLYSLQFFIHYKGFSVLCLPPAFTLVSCLPSSSTLKIEAKFTSETSVDFQRTTQHCIPEGRTL